MDAPKNGGKVVNLVYLPELDCTVNLKYVMAIDWGDEEDEAVLLFRDGDRLVLNDADRAILWEALYPDSNKGA